MITPPDQEPLLTYHAWTRLRRWYRRDGRHWLPWRQTSKPWAILLAETLLHRTNVNQAAKIYSVLLDEFKAPREVVEKERRWTELTKPIGLGWRSECFVKTCKILHERFDGIVPAKTTDLLLLPGIGHYTAAAVQCFGFGERADVVDTNTIRIAARVAGESAKPGQHRTRRVQSLVHRLGPRAKPPLPQENYALLDLAALICVPRIPKCVQCPIRLECATGNSVFEAHPKNEPQ